MELTPDTFTVSVCLIREVTPPGSIRAYPYRDVTLVSDPVTHSMRFPEYPADSFRPADLGEDAEGAEEVPFESDKSLRVFVLRESAMPAPDPSEPTTFQSEQSLVRVLMSEVASGKCCHARIHPCVRDVLFPKPGTRLGEDAVHIDADSSLGYSPADRGRLASTLALVLKDGSTDAAGTDPAAYHPLPLIGYHGTSEYFVNDVLTSGGLRRTTSLGLYGNQAYYFGSFDKAVRYAFRDSQYATVGETAALRTETRPAGYIRVPGTRHVSRGDASVQEDLFRDSPALVRFVVFPSTISRFPRDKPIKTLPLHGSTRGGPGHDVDNGGRFLRFTNAPGDLPKKDEAETRERVLAAVESPLFRGDEDAISLIGLTDKDPVVPVPQPVSLVDRQKAVLMASLHTHIATRPEASCPSVILLREPGTLPDLADFFLMTSGFLTKDPRGVAGDTITYLNEDEIRELTTETQLALGGGEGSDTDGTRPRPLGALGAMTDHRILMEDLVSVSPAESPVLVSCATLTPSSVLRIRDLLAAKRGGNPVVVVRASGSTRGAGGKDHDAASPHSYTDDELSAIRSNLDDTVRQLGGATQLIRYTPPKSNVFGKGIVTAKAADGSESRVCSLRMDHTTVYIKGKRLMNTRAVHSAEYEKEYPTGGSYRVYKLVQNPAKVPSEEQIRNLLDTLRGEGWNPEGGGESDTLVVQPFSYEAPSRGRGKTTIRSLTQHTEIVVSAEKDGDVPPRFVPLSWHRGDQRTMYRHHHPMDTGMRVI